MRPDISLRAARPDERQALEDLQRRASLVSPMYGDVLRANPDAIALPAEHMADTLVATQNGEIVGFCVVLRRSEDEADLNGLFVEPRCWNQGIGRRLVQEAERRAAAQGAHSLCVTANPEALAFYRACAFGHTGEVETRFGNAPAMRKILARP